VNPPPDRERGGGCPGEARLPRGAARHTPAGAGKTFRRHKIDDVNTVLLLIASNTFMTVAWYGHLRYGHDWPLWQAILVSWFIALFEYCLAVPANRFGYGQFSGFQLKIIQEVVTLAVFVGFAAAILKERMAWNHLVAFAFLGGAAFFAFAFPAPSAAP
jgi:uncharacterized protein (DUF486 family)